VVVDLGSGGGFDVFIAAQKIGPRGRAIGVDMNHVCLSSFRKITMNMGFADISDAQDMIELARRNAGRHSYNNVSFVQSDITSTPLADGTADCIISNCVINLVPQSRKHLVFKDMFRLLKTGGRIAVSDLLALKELPDAIRSNIAAYVGCIAGAAQVSQYEQWLREAGFTGESLLTEVKRS
jgi:arsenite methyltransferase